MTTTKLQNKGHLSKFQRHEIAKQALGKSAATKPVITIIAVNKYITFVQVSYLEDSIQKYAMIRIKNLEEYITENAGTLPQPGVIDMNLAQYLEESLYPVCAGYLRDGKELMV